MKRKLISLILVFIFVTLLVLPVYADENPSAASSSQTVTDTTYATTQTQTYQTTQDTTYSQTYSTQNTQTPPPASSSTTTSATYSSTYQPAPSAGIIPSIPNDNLNLKEPSALTKERKRTILNLIHQINQLRAKFNKINAETNYLRAKLNAYLQAAKRYDRYFFNQELNKIINEVKKTISQLQKELNKKNYSSSKIAEINAQLNQKLNELKVYEEVYKNQLQQAVDQAVYQIKQLTDQIQPTVSQKVYQINSIDGQIKVKFYEYHQTIRTKDYNKMIALLNEIIALYQTKINLITEVKNLYTDLIAKVENIIKGSLNIPKKYVPQVQQKKITIPSKGNSKIEIRIFPQKGKKK